MAVAFAAKACGTIAITARNKQTINFIHVFIFSPLLHKIFYRGFLDYNCNGPASNHISIEGALLFFGQ
jgi:hypothetical protein